MMEREKLVSLVTAVQSGKESAAGELYDGFYSDIYYFILKTVNSDPELAADLTQDSFMEILENIHKLEEPAAFVTWSKQIAYHKCTAYFRKRREILLDESEDGYSAFDTVEEDRAEFIPDEALDREDFKQTIHAMISGLPEEQRSALLLRYFNEISVKEIARIQGVTEGTVKSRLNYARKAIKQAVESYEAKSGVRLHCAGVVPMLLWFFRAYRRAQGVAITAGSAAAVFAAPKAAAATGTAAAAAAKTGIFGSIKAFAQTLAGKIVAGVTAAAVVVGGTAVVVTQLNKEEPEVWSGYIQGHDVIFNPGDYQNGGYNVNPQNVEYNVIPQEGTEMYVELEILEAEEYYYDAVLRVDWEWGRYETECRLKNTRSYDNVVVYTAEIPPVYLSASAEIEFVDDVITSVNIQHAVDSDSINVRFPGLRDYYGDLFTEDFEDSVFLNNPIEEEPNDIRFEGYTVEDVRFYWPQPDGSYLWMTSEEAQELERSIAVVDEYGGYTVYERIMFARLEGKDWAMVLTEGLSMYEEPQTHVVIPAEIDGYPVTELAPLTSIHIETIEIPDTITAVPAETFWNSENLQRVFLPGSIRTIGESAFSHCRNLQSMEIPEGVESLGDEAFLWCERMKSVALPSTLTELGVRLFYHCPALETITVAPGNEVYHSSGSCLIETGSGILLAGCKGSVIPDDGSVRTIGSFSFAANTALRSLVIPEGVEEIDYCAFAKCLALTELHLPASMKSIDDQAFIFCENLTDIYYAGTMEDFEDIRGIQWDAEYQDFDLTIHCADGTLTIG